MQSIFNKHVVFLLCFIINVTHLYECATQINVHTNDLPAPLSATAAPIESSSTPILSENEPADVLASESVAPLASSRQLRKVVMGNYRSSYVGASKSNRRLSSSINQHQVSNTNRQLDDGSSSNEDDAQTVAATAATAATVKTKKKQLTPIVDEFGDEIKYNVGPGVNVGIEKNRGLVSLYLDEDCLKDVLTGWPRNYSAFDWRTLAAYWFVTFYFSFLIYD